ncbi:MAG: serine protease [Terriglobia bacterium]|jgi:S1-C subfamily serine protease
MFSHAISIASEYIRPIIVTKRLENQSITCGMGTFIVINDAGWVLTAAHVVQDLALAQQHKIEREKYQNDIAIINANPTYSIGKKKHEINQLKKNWEWITHFSLWWAANGIVAATFQIDPITDLAITQLTGPLDNLQVKNFPIFANPATPIKQGTSLCRIGFPFHQFTALFDSSTGNFSIPDLPPLATFPNDGILTRNVMFTDSATKRQTHFLETSTPGLRGQSGGPIFDTNGNVWAMQSRTSHLSLGFSPTVKVNGKQVTEHQFMHVGWGVHVSHIRELLEKFQVQFKSE